MSVKSKATETPAPAVQAAAPAIQPAPAVQATPAVQPGPEAAEKVTAVVKRGPVPTAAAARQATTEAVKQVTTTINEAAEKGKKQMSENMEKAMKTAEEFVSFNQGNIEAMIKSGQILATGIQDLGKQVAATAQTRFEEGMATFRAFGSVKSVKEAIDLQASYARASMEKAMADTGKFTDASFKLAEQAIAPLTARVTLAIEKFSKAV